MVAALRGAAFAGALSSKENREFKKYKILQSNSDNCAPRYAPA
jgi:hypothetical protein